MRCSICGFKIDKTDASGPGPHRFHGACINGALNFLALTTEVGGKVEINRMAVWLNAERAGVRFPFPPFKASEQMTKGKE